ncbi:hypothetical protein HYV49_06160 [Candidatus Pacearchaeota archaeon]|nr:hypothetical protein [Candidatus Pacearchaeota archaeon]
MPNYKFLEDGEINRSDIERLIQLTRIGILQWWLNDGYCAFSAYPNSQRLKDDEEYCKSVIGENIKGSRLGFNPDTKLWHYLRITDYNKNYHYIEEHHPQELVELVNQLYTQAVLQASKREGMSIIS